MGKVNYSYGILIHPEELTNNMMEILLQIKPQVLGLHPIGGADAVNSLNAVIDLWNDKEFSGKLNRLRHNGTKIEIECHALGWLVPRSEFAEHPEWFRMNEKGERTPDCNICSSNEQALTFLRKRSAELARLLPSDTGRYYFWIDDVKSGACHCPRCRRRTPSDQALILYRTILNGIRQVDPKAEQCYLAYNDTLTAPTEPEHDGLFLEFAPIDRDTLQPLQSEKNREQLSYIAPLMNYFEKDNSKVLEYWSDNSLFSGWKKPPKKLQLDLSVVSEDVKLYKKYGFEHIASFACYLSDDYAALYGKPPLKELIDVLSEEMLT